MAGLPRVTDATLPTNYEAACSALQNCDQIDECKTWADKAAALASYAKQAEDESLHRHATRIRARAIRRAGQLLEQIEPRQGANQNIDAAAGTKVLTRKQARKDAGMSHRQAHQAQRVARVDDEQFDAMIEGDSPATVTEIASRGRKFTRQQVTEARVHTRLNHLLEQIEKFDAAFDWPDIQKLNDKTLAIKCDRFSILLKEIAKCIRAKN